MSTYYIHEQFNFVTSFLHTCKILGDIAIGKCIPRLRNLNNFAIDYLIINNMQYVINIPKSNIFLSLPYNTGEYLWLSYIDYKIREAIPEFYEYTGLDIACRYYIRI